MYSNNDVTHFLCSRSENWMNLTFFLLPLMCQAAAAAKLLQSCVTLCDPIDGKPISLLCPWDSPGKNTGVGSHFLFQCMHAC